MRFITGCLIFALISQSLAQEPAAGKLNIVVVEGEGAINNVRQRVARETIVQVEDENRKPVAGAAITFFLPNQGPGGVFSNGSQSFSTVTDAQGRAMVRGMRPNNLAGKYEMRVNASHQGKTGTTTINQTNMMVAAAVAGGISAKLIAILVVAGAAAAGGTAFALSRGDDTPPGSTAIPPTILSPGTPNVGPPR